MNHRRKVLKGLSLISLSCLLPKKSYGAPEILKKTEWPVAIFYPSHCASPIVFASIKKWYAEAGLNIKLVNFPSMPNLVKSFVKDGFLAAQIPVPLLLMTSIKRILNNEDPILLSSILGVHGSALLVTAKSGINSPRDLKNKKLASPSPGVIHYLLARTFLEKYNLDLNRDTIFMELPLNEVLNKVQKNEVDVVLFPEPYPSLVEYNIATKNLISTQFIWKNHPCCALAIKKSLYDREKEAIKILTSITIKSSYYIDRPNNREELIQELKKSRFHKPELTDKVLQNAFKPGRSDFNPYPYYSMGLIVIDMLQRYKLIPKVDTNDMVKRIFLTEWVKGIYAELKLPIPSSDYRTEVIMGEPVRFT